MPLDQRKHRARKANPPIRRFAQGRDAFLVFRLNRGRHAVRQLPRAFRRHDDERKAVGNGIQAVFNRNPGHACSKKRSKRRLGGAQCSFCAWIVKVQSTLPLERLPGPLRTHVALRTLPAVQLPLSREQKMADEKEKDPLIGTTFANRYAIQGRLGKGGMAVVYKAMDTQMGREVAVKVLRPDVADEVAAKRLIREAKGAGALNHPNIITIFDRGIWEDRVYIAMEILNGQEMSSLMENEGAIPVERALKICEQVASALAVAHAEGIIHRDIKPENLFLLNRSGGDVVKMLDFSIAKLPKEMVTQQLTRAGSVFGTPHYMAPEQVEGKQAVPQTDLYALGAVMYELIAGEPPFDGASVIDILLKHVKAPAPTLERPGLELPPGLNDLVKELLAKKPADRPQSAEIVRERIADMRAAMRMNGLAQMTPAAMPVPPTAPKPIPQPVAEMATAAPPPVRLSAPTPARQLPPRAPDPKNTTAAALNLPQAALPTSSDTDDERTIVGVGMSAKLNEMVAAQKAAQASAGRPATGQSPAAQPQNLRPPTAQVPKVPANVLTPESDEGEAKTMAVSRETLQAVQAGRKPATMVPSSAPTSSAPSGPPPTTRPPSGATQAAQGQQPQSVLLRVAGRDTVDDRSQTRQNRETATDLPVEGDDLNAVGQASRAQSEAQSRLWLVAVAIGAAVAGAGFAWWFTHR